MASPVNPKVTYHSVEGIPIIVNADVYEATRIKNTIQKELLASVKASKVEIE